jgi:hypothetical protein
VRNLAATRRQRTEIADYFKRLEVTGDDDEKLIVSPDGTWMLKPQRATKK